MQFKVGDKAVYPAHGVAEITSVEARDVGGSKVDCYVLNIVSSGAKVMVPVTASKRAGMVQARPRAERRRKTPGESIDWPNPNAIAVTTWTLS